MNEEIDRPAWLPKIIIVDGDWDTILTSLYAIFRSDFVTSVPRFKELQVWHDRRKLEDDYEEGFWHVTHKDEWVFDPDARRDVKQRIFDPRRSERLPWCRPTVENEPEPEVLCWEYKESKGNIRTYVWLQKHDYLVILEKQTKRFGDIYMLITAFFVEHDSYYRNLNRKYRQSTNPC